MSRFTGSFIKAFQKGIMQQSTKFRNRTAEATKKPDKPNQTTKLIDSLKPPHVATPYETEELNRKRASAVKLWGMK